MSTSSSSSTSIPEARPRGASGQGTAVAEAAAVVAEVDGQAAGGTDDASAVSIDAVPDDSHQKVQAVARLHPSWFKGKGAEAELKETAVTADPRLVTFKGQKIIFMGYLLKFGKTLFKSDWKKRFFVLTPDFLCKFSSRDDYMDGKNADTTIDLYECTVVTAEQETSQPFSFKITCPRFKPAEGSSVTPGFVLLAAENAWELVEWTKSIENHGTRGWQSLITEASFQKLHKVGSGSYGSVYQVKKLDTQKIYAMKVLSKANFTEETQLRALSNERKVLEAVSHAFIVRLHFAFQSDFEYFFVLDFMAGGDFFAFLKRHRKLNEDQTRFYAAEVLLALEYMHSYDPPIAYRDLKPENIMIGIDGHIKLTDFGFAKFFGEEMDPFDAAGSPRRERSHSIVGSAFYIAPEIVNSSKAEGHDLSVDFWSFGCLIYEMVCGHALFADPKSLAMFEQMKRSGQISKGSTFQQFTMHRLLNTKESASFPSSVSKPLLSLLNTLLQRNPDLRCKSWTQVKQHEFFQSIDFAKLIEKRSDPPFVPSLSKGYQDISMFEDASAVDISMSRPPNKHSFVAGDPGSPNTAQVHDFHFQAKTSQILTESAKKSRPAFVDAAARAPRVAPSEVPTFSGMRRSKSSESLDTASKHAGSASPSIDPQQAPPIAALESDKAQRSPINSSRSDQSPGLAAAAAVTPAAAAAAATSTAAAVTPTKKLTPVELAAEFFASCGWDNKAAAASLVEALADPKNPQLAEKKFQHAAALFSNEVTTAIL